LTIDKQIKQMNIRFPSGGRPTKPNDTARYQVPGQFIALPDGIVHYEITGPPDGQLVVLIHGFAVPCFIWDPTFHVLAEAGFSVLRYDLYGRGYSQRPYVAYDSDLFDRQLYHLIEALDFPKPVDLVGVSMGCVIAANFTNRHPSWIRKICMIDPAGVTSKPSLGARLAILPILGELRMFFSGEKALVSGLLDDFHKPDLAPANYEKRFREQLRVSGFKRALLSTLRHGLLHGALKIYKRIGGQKRPILLIWGKQDRITPFANNTLLREVMQEVEFFPIDRAGHIPHYECPDRINPILVRFLKKC